MTTCEDVAAAICFLEHSKRTHEAWAGWLTEGHEESLDAGDLEHHEHCVLEYEHVLDVFRALVSREGELVAALEEFRQPSGHFVFCDTARELGLGKCTPACAKARAALAKCDTCKGSRVAPGDPDLGGAGVTNSSCPDCVPQGKKA